MKGREREINVSFWPDLEGGKGRLFPYGAWGGGKARVDFLAGWDGSESNSLYPPQKKKKKEGKREIFDRRGEGKKGKTSLYYV